MANGDRRLYGIVDMSSERTTDATPKKLCAFALPRDASAYCIGEFLAQDEDTGATMVGGRAIGIAHNRSDLTVVYQTKTAISTKLDTYTTGYTADIYSTGTEEFVQLRVTGGAGDNVRWFGTLMIYHVEAATTA